MDFYAKIFLILYPWSRKYITGLQLCNPRWKRPELAFGDDQLPQCRVLRVKARERRLRPLFSHNADVRFPAGAAAQPAQQYAATNAQSTQYYADAAQQRLAEQTGCSAEALMRGDGSAV